MKYEKGELQFKGLNFSWNLITTEKGEYGEYEVFNFEVEHKEVKIRQEFKNSVMECEISRKLNLNKPYSSRIKELRPKMCGGYDKDLDDKTPLQIRNFDRKRVYWLLYSFIQDFSNYVEWDLFDFKEFCSSYGYEEDSLKALKIHSSCIEYYREINTLNLTEEQREYFLEVVRSEEEEFNKEVKFQIKEQY
jgi:hypothetical protein